MIRRPVSFPRTLRGAALAALVAAACAEPPTAAPEPPGPRAAKGGIPGPPGGGSGGDDGSGGSDPTVEDTDPGSAPKDTTLDVRVFGSSFDDGSRVAFLLDGETTKNVKTNSTAFVSSTELIANITITIDAKPDLYDVQVTTSKGKKGVGIELFEVTAPPLDLGDRPADPAPAGLYEDGLGIYLGGFNVTNGGQGNGNYHAIPDCAEPRGMDLVLPDAWDVAGTLSVCDWKAGTRGDDGQRVRFHVPGLLYADCPDGQRCPIGGDPAFGEGGFAPTLNYYFEVDADGDGRFGERDEPVYNVVWTDGTFAVVNRAPDGAACRFHLTASTADLWQGESQHPATGAAVALDAVVTRIDGSCAP